LTNAPRRAHWSRESTDGLWVESAWRDGVERIVYEHADITFHDSGRPVRMIGAVQDVTERKRTGQALRATDRHKNEFLAMLSHELRNPPAPIRYALDLLEAQSKAEGSRPKEIIERQLPRAALEDVLEIAQQRPQSLARSARQRVQDRRDLRTPH
jgi:signal transduction histidine kinase